MDRIALVTGGNTGIGYEIVRGLAMQGITVYLGARDPEKGAAAAAELYGAGEVRAVTLDTTVELSMSEALKAIGSAHGRLDILVNNAGIALPGPVLDTDAETVRLTYETNLHGPMRLIQLALPLMRNSAAPRIVNVSSAAGSIAFLSSKHPMANMADLPYAYCTAKAAMNAATAMFAAALKGDGFKVNACNPGYVKSKLNDYAGTLSPQEGAEVAIRLATLDADGPNGGFFDKDGPIPW